MIPKVIFSIWLGSDPPELVKKCLETHQIPGFEHKFITSESFLHYSPYLTAALEAKQWVKAADYLRIRLLHDEGGIYLDADMEVLGPIEDLLRHEFFACIEENRFIANSVIGSVKGHPILKECLERMEQLNGADERIFENGMEVFSSVCYQNLPKICLLPSECFFPYNHQTNVVHKTPNTRAYHHFLKSWL